MGTIHIPMKYVPKNIGKKTELIVIFSTKSKQLSIGNRKTDARESNHIYQRYKKRMKQHFTLAIATVIIVPHLIS